MTSSCVFFAHIHQPLLSFGFPVLLAFFLQIVPPSLSCSSFLSVIHPVFCERKDVVLLALISCPALPCVLLLGGITFLKSQFSSKVFPLLPCYVLKPGLHPVLLLGGGT